ncbi:MAG: crossover junction endodeoxyribonuclease RuvC [Anaerolineae bacterium]|jgi:crossover junction endodeoxyribonuclease RuvC|nr:crossover junction endodeoxyribonuclease RuvC [Anaerolineae bacterium]MDH7472506.1 crossover junction endodeoxyribonuclease RuvC [Anaerolineae bacterium]
MLVLGLDPGTAITGYGLVREVAGELSVVEYGAITTPAQLPEAERLLQIHRQLSALISQNKPAAMAVEKLFFSRNVRTAMAVGQARGVALLTAAQAGLPVYEYTPSEVKQAIAGYGGASKEQVQQMVQLLLGLKEAPQPDDAADAIAVAVCHLHSTRLVGLLKHVGQA